MRRLPPFSCLLLLLPLLAIGVGGCGDETSAPGAAGKGADPGTLEDLPVPLSGSNPSRVVGAIAFNRFHLLTADDGFEKAAADKTLPPDVAGVDAEGRAHLAAGRARSAARAFQHAAVLARAAKDGPSEERTLLRALHCLDPLDEEEDLLATAGRILALREERRDSLAAARSRADEGAIYGRVGNPGRALDRLGAAAEAFARFGLKRRQAHALASMGLVQLRASEYGPALDVLERARALLRGTRSKPHRAYVLNLLGNVEQTLGDVAAARVLYEEALLLYGSARTVDAADVRGNLANVHLLRHETAAALQRFREARAIYEARHDATGTARALFSLGRIQKEQGAYRTALETYRAALALQDAESADAARTRGAMAETLLAMDRPDDALYEIESAMENVGSETSRVVRAELLVVDALAWLRKRQPQRAVQKIRRALDALVDATSGLADEHVLGLRDQRGWVFDAGLAVAIKTGRVDLAVEFLEYGRAGALIEALGGRGARHGLPAALAEAERIAGMRVASAHRRYLAARAARKRKPLRAARDALDAARTAYRSVQLRIQREVQSVASVYSPVPDSLADIRAGLAPGDVFVLYALLPFQAHALVVTHERARMVWLGNTADVRSACQTLRAGSAEPDDDEAALAGRIATLRHLTIAPLGLPADTKRLLISPDGPLCYVPFALLLEDRPDLEIAALPSGTTLRLLGHERARTGRGVLALGDPNYVVEYQGRSLQVYAEGVPLEALPATRREVLAITGPKDQRLLGSYATLRNLTEVAASRQRWSAIHLACHGLIDPRTPTLSALAFTPEPDDDGFLTALEVYGMHLPADLVVLSGCNTGRGALMKGEGLVGLMRAFMCAGAPRVIVSLWKVDDEATQALMSRFHALWRGGGISTAAALRQAQAAIRAQSRWQHPRYWAAWALWGLPE